MPKKGKKGKSEEGGAAPQQKAPAVEGVNQKEELLTLFLKEKLQKEQRNTAVNRLKLVEVWRTILRQSRGTELLNEAAVYRQAFERQLDEQDNIIEKMLQELQGAERQLAQVRHTHVQHVERLQAQQDQRLRSLEQHWGNILTHTGSMFSSESEQTQDEFLKQRAKMQSLVLSTEQRHEEEMKSIHQIFDDCQVHHEDYRLIPEELEDHKTLQESLMHLEKLTIVLSKKTEKNNRTRKNIEKLQVTSQLLKEKLTGVKAENKSHLEDLKAARDEVNGKCHKLQDWLSETRGETRDRLTRLAVQGNDASKKLQAAIGKGELVLRGAEICRKLEKKLDVCTLPSLSPLFQPSSDHTQVLTEPVRAAMLQKQVVLQHKDSVHQENQQLRVLLHHVIEDGTLEGGCTALVISQAPTTDSLTNSEAHYNIIEAAHAIKHSM